MRIITVEEHFMVKEINDRFNKVIKPNDEFDKNQFGFVSMFVERGKITELDKQCCIWFKIKKVHYIWRKLYLNQYMQSNSTVAIKQLIEYNNTVSVVFTYTRRNICLGNIFSLTKIL